MSKIVIDARELRTSSGRYVERLLNYLQMLESEHVFTILLKPQDMAGWEPSNPQFQKLACPHQEFTFGEQFGLRHQLNSLNADLVHFPFVQQPIWYGGPVVTTIQDLTTLRYDNPAKNLLVFRFKQWVYGYVIKRAAYKSLRVMVPSQFVKDDVANFTGLEPDKITVTYEAADAISGPPEPLRALHEKRFIMYIGRPTPHKNLDRLVEAFSLLQAQHPDLVLVLAGKKDANYQRIETAVDARGLDNVRFTDYINEGQLRWLYENCSAYVFPSLSEGFGLPGLEAMVHGAPVVSSTATCLPEIYGDAAHYFDPLDTQAMADAINEVLNDKELRHKLIRAGRQQAHQYSWQRMAEQTLEIYDQALGA